MKYCVEQMKVQLRAIDLIMHYTNPLWLFCRLYKLIGKKLAKRMIFGWYETMWYNTFRNSNQN